MTTATPQIALCFFGITRSLTHTRASIETNVIAPLRALGDLKVFAHFFRQTRIDNPRSGEFGALDPDEHRLLDCDSLLLDAPDGPDVTALYEAVALHGSAWEGDFATLRNLCHQLVSLEKVTTLAAEHAPDIVAFCRPDLVYHDSLGPMAARARAADAPTVYLPYWQAFGGHNDRFCIASGRPAYLAYGLRGRIAVQTCARTERPLHSERLVAAALEDVRVETRPERASRMRSDGTRRAENFDTPRTARKYRYWRRRIARPRLLAAVLGVLRMLQALRHGPRYRGLNG